MSSVQPMDRWGLSSFCGDGGPSTIKTRSVVVDGRLTYCTDKKAPGVIRPWQCGWRADFSLSATVEPDVATNLMELICTKGLPSYECPRCFVGDCFARGLLFGYFGMKVPRFLSDANTVGIGKIAATDVPNEFLENPYTECKALEPYSSSALIET